MKAGGYELSVPTDIFLGHPLTFGVVCVTALRSSTLSVHLRGHAGWLVSNHTEHHFGDPQTADGLSSNDLPGTFATFSSQYNSNCIVCRYRYLQMT